MRLECPRLRLLDVGVESNVGDRGAKETPSRRRLADCTQQVLFGATLENITCRAVPECFGNERARVLWKEKTTTRVAGRARGRPAELRCRLNSAWQGRAQARRASAARVAQPFPSRRSPRRQATNPIPLRAIRVVPAAQLDDHPQSERRWACYGSLTGRLSGRSAVICVP